MLVVWYGYMVTKSGASFSKVSPLKKGKPLSLTPESKTTSGSDSDDEVPFLELDIQGDKKYLNEQIPH